MYSLFRVFPWVLGKTLKSTLCAEPLGVPAFESYRQLIPFCEAELMLRQHHAVVAYVDFFFPSSSD